MRQHTIPAAQPHRHSVPHDELNVDIDPPEWLARRTMKLAACMRRELVKRDLERLYLVGAGGIAHGLQTLRYW